MKKKPVFVMETVNITEEEILTVRDLRDKGYLACMGHANRLIDGGVSEDGDEDY